MQKEFAAGIEELNAATVESVKRLGEIQMRAMEKLTEQQIAVTSEYLREGVKQMQSLAGSQDVAKAVENQANYLNDFNKRVVEDTQKTAAILAESKSELTAWMEEGMKSAADSPVAKAFNIKAG